MDQSKDSKGSQGSNQLKNSLANGKSILLLLEREERFILHFIQLLSKAGNKFILAIHFWIKNTTNKNGISKNDIRPLARRY
jgi:hypothetical protein